MSTLSKTVQNTKFFILIFIVFIVLVIIIQFITSSTENNTNQPISTTRYYSFPNSLNASYTRLNLNSLSLSNPNSSDFVVTGNFPDFPPIVNVYKIQQKRVNLSNFEFAEGIADKLGMPDRYIKIDDNNYKWKGGINNLEFNYNTIDQKIIISKDLLQIESIPDELKDDSEYIKSAISVTNQLGIDLQEGIEVTGEVFKVNPTSLNNFEIIEDQNKFFTYVTLRKILPSSNVLPQYENSTDPNIPKTVSSQIYRPNLVDGYIKLIFQNNAEGLDDLVYLEINPSNYTESTANTTDEFDIEIYEMLELGRAVENIKSKETGVYLTSLQVNENQLFPDYTPLSVLSFNIDAGSTEVVYLEPENWDHLNPDVEWDAHVYPFYKFVGKATLSTGEVADFTFLVDAIPTN